VGRSECWKAVNVFVAFAKASPCLGPKSNYRRWIGGRGREIVVEIPFLLLLWLGRQWPPSRYSCYTQTRQAVDELLQQRDDSLATAAGQLRVRYRGLAVVAVSTR
jgi:hypothetical protein